MKKFLERVLLTSMIAVSCVSFAACGNGADEAKYGRLQDDTFFNTLRVDRMLGDPFLMEHDGYYYFTCSEGQQITVTKSSHMTQLTPGDENAKVIFRQADIGAQEIWAPEFFWLDGHFYCYFTASRGANSAELDLNRRIWVMKSKTDDALGEWEKPQKIELPCDYWAIDATFLNWQGRQWILWSGWPYAENNNWEQRIYITELETGNPTKVKSLDPAARIQISKPIYKDWESVGAWMNEGPAVVVSPGGRPYCFYSTNSSQGNFYCMAYCTLLGDTTEEMLANIMNPETDAYGNSVGWRKEEKPFMEADIYDKEVIAPGHNSFTKSPDGTEDWIVYHSTKVYQDTISRAGWDRLVRYQKLSWKDDAPYLEYYPYFSEEIPVPSGEKTKKYVYEAEKATLTDGCIIVDSTDEYKGAKYEFASGGKSVRLTGEEDTLTFNVNVKQSGRYVLQVRWANRSDVEAISVTVNGKETNLYAPKGNSYNCFMTNGLYTDLYVRGDRPNEVVIKCDRNILIDCIIVDYLDR